MWLIYRVETREKRTKELQMGEIPILSLTSVILDKQEDTLWTGSIEDSTFKRASVSRCDNSLSFPCGNQSKGASHPSFSLFLHMCDLWVLGILNWHVSHPPILTPWQLEAPSNSEKAKADASNSAWRPSCCTQSILILLAWTGLIYW